MNKLNYYNTVTLQAESLFNLVDIQAERCFNADKLNSIMSPDEFAAIENVVLTGCGDSYSAAGAMRSVFVSLSGVSMTHSPDPMEFTRFWTNEDIVKDEGRKSLVVAVSASGGADRIVEILEKGKAAGARTMLISNNPSSKGAKAAELFFHVDTPELCNTPGLRSYFASMVGIAALGAHIGVCKGHISLKDFEDIKNALIIYVKSIKPFFAKIDDMMFNLSTRWKDFSRYDVIGDGSDYFTAQFVEEKLIECAGVHSSHVDSEDWCHINFFLRDPGTVGTIVHAFKAANSFNRLVETANTAASIGRPIVVVTDKPDAGFDERITVCAMPSPPEGYEWLSTMINFTPGSLISGYVAAVAEKKFFAGRYDFRKQEWNFN